MAVADHRIGSVWGRRSSGRTTLRVRSGGGVVRHCLGTIEEVVGDDQCLFGGGWASEELGWPGRWLIRVFALRELGQLSQSLDEWFTVRVAVQYPDQNLGNSCEQPLAESSSTRSEDRMAPASNAAARARGVIFSSPRRLDERHSAEAKSACNISSASAPVVGQWTCGVTSRVVRRGGTSRGGGRRCR